MEHDTTVAAEIEHDDLSRPGIVHAHYRSLKVLFFCCNMGHVIPCSRKAAVASVGRFHRARVRPLRGNGAVSEGGVRQELVRSARTT